MNGCFDNQLRAVVFDGVKTSRMLSCQAVTISHDVRGVASLAWGGVRGTGGVWLVIDHAAQPSSCHPSRHPARVNRQCWIIHCELRAFVLFLELFVLIRNRPIIGRLFGTDYRPTDIGASLTSTSSQLLNITTQHITSAAPWPCFTVKMWFCFVWIHIQWKMEKSHASHFICDIQYNTTETRPRCNIYQ